MKHLQTISFILLCILQVIIFYVEANALKSYISIALNAQYLISFCFVISSPQSISQSYRHIYNRIIVLIVWVVFCVIVSGVTYSSFVHSFLFILTLGIWFNIGNKILSSYKNVLITTFICLSIFICFVANSGRAYNMVLNVGPNAGMEVIGNNLTLGLNNPNETGSFLYFTITILLSLSFMKIPKIIQMVLRLFACYCCYLLVLTGCRSCLIALLIVLLLFTVYYKNKRLFNNKRIVLTIICFPILFCIIYLYLCTNSSLWDVELLGKPLFSGREELFSVFLKDIVSISLFGDTSTYLFSNMLNLYITLLANIGILGVLFYIVTSYKVINLLSSTIMSKSQLFAYVSILGLYINACSESSLLVAGGKWFFFALVLYLIASDDSAYTNKLMKY